MFSALQVSQLDIAGISGALRGVLATGEVVRPLQLDPFITQAEQDLYELRVLGLVTAGSGVNYNTGQAILSLNYASGAFVESGIRATGLFLAQLYESQTSGAAATGLSLYRTLTGLSGAFNSTGLSLAQRDTGVSGALNATGTYLNNWLTGISGMMNQTGLAYDPRRLSGIFNATGLRQAKALQNLTGAMNLTGLSLAREIRNLSGSMNLTGLSLSRDLRNLSGSMNQSGRGLITEIETYRIGFLRANGLSGDITITGTGLAYTFINGQTLTVQIDQPGEDPAKVISLNGQTGSLFVTGSGSLVLHTINTGFYISGADGILPNETGQFASLSNLFQSGSALFARDIQWSGELFAANESNRSGVYLLNGLSGAFILTGTGGGVASTTGIDSVILSGGGLINVPTVSEMPHWATSTPDYNSAPLSFDDDFTGLYLKPQWSGINLNLDGSGILNSSFYAYSKATAVGGGITHSKSLFTLGVSTGRDWETSIKMNVLPRFVNYNGAGLFVRNATSNRVTSWQGEWDVANGNIYIVVNYNGNDFSSTTALSGGFNDLTNIYLRLQSRGGLFNYDYSNDGIVWRKFLSNTANSWVSNINQVGFFVDGIGSQVGLSVDWFRATGLT